MSLPDLLLQAICGFAATVGFAILFNVPRDLLLAVGLVGSAGHLLRIILRGVGASNEVATFAGALLVGLFGFYQARRWQFPRLVFTVTGVISMVPGVAAYETVVYFGNDKILDGLQSGVHVALLVGAIALGLGLARILIEQVEG